MSLRRSADVLELLANVDPLSAIMAGLWILAAGMFPVGLILGGCPCCGCPSAMTVTLSGYQDQYGEPVYLTSLEFSSCFGSGATGRLTAPHVENPGDDPTKAAGPIESVEITNGGSGYAKLGRVAPTLTISGGSGTGATFTPSLATKNDDCGLPYWYLDSISVTGGTGYEQGESLTITAAEGDIQEQAASAKIEYGYEEPQNPIFFVLKPDASDYSAGTGAELEVVWGLLPPSSKAYEVLSVNVINGGSGYTPDDIVAFYFEGGGEIVGEAQMTAGTVGDGAIGSVSVNTGGEYYGNKIDGVQVTVTNGGRYYREDATVPALLADVTIAVNGAGLGDGNAVLDAVVDDDVESPTFGKITGVTITGAGDGYLAYAYKISRCATYFNGRTIAVPCEQTKFGECLCAVSVCDPTAGVEATLQLSPSGVFAYHVGAPPEDADNVGESLTEITLDDPPGGWTAKNANGVTAKVVPGGTPSDYMTAAAGNWFPCCRGGSTPPEEIEVEVWSQPLNIGTGEIGGWQFEYNAVLCRNCSPGEQGCRATWGAYTEPYTTWPSTFIQYARHISLTIESCDDAENGCDGCYRQCRTAATLSYRGGATLVYGSPPCDGCQGSPLCEPQAREYITVRTIVGAGEDGKHRWKMVVPE
jgi:hypothetical protein